ncbi:hypothetical protein M3I53_37500 [Paraburkholderia sp. CNPSo 3272]|uniref:hypothetical protein n=1 Tax=Paraburkholderia sp. CNPSo 3272 TaxID=2940931 RepID=UPI0020B80684|nr:hypothetical protein [Paraburkholderia sp. CNPSo 3272]MCP3728716.1 hypothetical protein [Paraburkholderia sp. CNPSo 3272]
MSGSSMSTQDRSILAEALAMLLRERSYAHRLAIEIAAARGEQGPDISEYGVVDILRLSREFAQDGPNRPEHPYVQRLLQPKCAGSPSRRTTVATSEN